MAQDKDYQLLTVKLYEGLDDDILEFFEDNPKTHSTKKALRMLIKKHNEVYGEDISRGSKSRSSRDKIDGDTLSF